jgi:glycosyltransferase involved in cell wall biosynthesis
MKLFITVVIATHNRAEHLINALDGLANQSLPKEDYEVIIVDNASTDNTKLIASEKASLFTHFSYFYEATPSANLARNIGWQKAAGEYVAYMDDDAIPQYNWLERLVQDFNTIQPKPGIVGGKVVPMWESARPGWLHPKLLGALSLVDYSDKPIFLEKKYPFSVNMAFQKQLLKEFGGFDLQLGRKGKKLLSGDETAISIRIKKAGYGIFYDPAALVKHFIPSNRLQTQWFKKRYYWGGYSEALMWRILEKPTSMAWLKKIAYYLYGFVRNPHHIFYLFYTPHQPEDFWLKCTVHARIGYIAGLFDSSN